MPAMLFVISPAKTLDFTPAPPELETTKPAMSADTAELAAVARKLKAADLKRLMGISDDLADLNVKRFKTFKVRPGDDGVPAALAFAGDVYTGLKARELDAQALAWAQDHLRIMSGLYGVLRPLDRIQPYRLEFGIKLANDRAPDLYGFWGDKPARALRAAARGMADRTLVNLASNEYFGGVDVKALKLPVLKCAFKQEQGNAITQPSFYAKVARGLMARFAIDARVEHREQLKRFDAEGYRFRDDLSSDAEFVFVRPHP